MKILFITGSLNQGGAEYQILELAKLFQDKGNDISLFAITDYTFYKPFVKNNNIKYNHLYNHQNKLKRVLLAAKKIRHEQPELIISYLRSPSQLALFAKILSGAKSKLIIGERTSLILPKHDKYYFNLMRFANYITINSISKLNYIKKKFPALKNKIAFFPNIIDIQKFEFLNKNFEKKIINIGFVGRISPEKNVKKLIVATKILIEKRLYVRLLIYGDARNSNYLDSVNKVIRENNLEKEVFLKGKIDNSLEAYKRIDILCLISDYEGFSNVLSEGLCCGLPIITSNIEENKYLIEDKKNGFIVDQKSSDSIARGILNYLKLPKELKNKIAMENRQKAEKIFDKDKLYNDYLKVIKSL